MKTFVRSPLNYPIIALFFSFTAHAAGLDPEAIIKAVDEVRNPSESFAMKVEVHSEGADDSVFEVSLKGNTRTLIKTLAPPRDKGRNLLMIEEEMWAYIPNLKRAVRVSLSQKLSGQAANGDISRMRWSGDYAPVIEKQDAKTVTLFLTAKKKGLTYDKIRATVEKNTNHPVKADFLTPAGKPLKYAAYGAFKSLAGRVRPSEITIRDANRADDVSKIKILEMTPKAFPDSLFNQNSLK